MGEAGQQIGIHALVASWRTRDDAIRAMLAVIENGGDVRIARHALGRLIRESESGDWYTFLTPEKAHRAEDFIRADQAIEFKIERHRGDDNFLLHNEQRWSVDIRTGKGRIVGERLIHPITEADIFDVTERQRRTHLHPASCAARYGVARAKETGEGAAGIIRHTAIAFVYLHAPVSGRMPACAASFRKGWEYEIEGAFDMDGGAAASARAIAASLWKRAGQQGSQ